MSPKAVLICPTWNNGDDAEQEFSIKIERAINVTRFTGRYCLEDSDKIKQVDKKVTRDDLVFIVKFKSLGCL